MSAIDVGAAFAMGLMGSAHCVAMCGPISTVLSRFSTSSGGAQDTGSDRRRLPMAEPPRTSPWLRITTQAGRVTTYGVLGAAFGAAGAGLTHAVALEGAELVARFLAAAVLVGAGLYVCGVFKRFSAIERLASPLFGPPRKWLGSTRSAGALGHFARGLAWGLLPCGLVLGALSLAVLAKTPHGGAFTMLAFGVGTLPALFAVDVFATTFRTLMRSVWLRRAAGALIVTSGIVQAALAVEGAETFGHEAERPCCAHRHPG